MTPQLDSDVEFMISTIEPGVETEPKNVPTAGARDGYILNGRLELWVDEEKFDLFEGDSYRFNRSVHLPLPQSIENRARHHHLGGVSTNRYFTSGAAYGAAVYNLLNELQRMSSEVWNEGSRNRIGRVARVEMGYSACAPFLTTAFVQVLCFELMVDVVCVKQPQASGRKRSMKHYAGLGVSVKETAICIVDETGRICRETKVVSHPEGLSKALAEAGFRIELIGLEAGPLSQWLFEGMARAGLPVICVETRHTKAFLRAQVNKSDRNDARGIAQMMRVNLYRPVHVKTLASQ